MHALYEIEYWAAFKQKKSNLKNYRFNYLDKNVDYFINNIDIFYPCLVQSFQRLARTNSPTDRQKFLKRVFGFRSRANNYMSFYFAITNRHFNSIYLYRYEHIQEQRNFDDTENVIFQNFTVFTQTSYCAFLQIYTTNVQKKIINYFNPYVLFLKFNYLLNAFFFLILLKKKQLSELFFLWVIY